MTTYRLVNSTGDIVCTCGYKHFVHLYSNVFECKACGDYSTGSGVKVKEVREPEENVELLPAGQIIKFPNPERVNHPAHYGGDSVYEVIKVLHAWGLEDDALLWNVVKYIARAGKKEAYTEDLKKAQWYLNKKLERLAHGPNQSKSEEKSKDSVRKTTNKNNPWRGRF